MDLTEDPAIHIKVQRHVLANAQMETLLSADESMVALAGKLALYYTQQRVRDSFEVAEFLGEVDKNATVDFKYGLMYFLFIALFILTNNISAMSEPAMGIIT